MSTTASSEQQDAILEPRLVGDIKGRFFVPAYQRGYRWGRDEVGRLLADIDDSRGKPYYLQPIVVKASGDDQWELVDGQQRLTTLFLILGYIRTHVPTAARSYTMEYETRELSAAFLEEPTRGASGDNIDFFHIFEAADCIQEWFESRSNPALAAINFYTSLAETVRVIWYEAPRGLDSVELFRRLNVGHIPLTDTELVKALLLTRSDERAPEIAAQWDSIERDLRSPELWAFITGSAEEEATHLRLLLDTLSGGPVGRDRPLFHTFETLRHGIDTDPYRFWEQVVDLHSLLVGWHDDRDLFHKIGFLVADGDRFTDLVELAQGATKSSFSAQLDAKISRRLRLTEAELCDLTYQSSKSGRVLLLMNVETIRQMTHSSERYSFRAHATERWSLEHLHAQNADELQTVEQWREWLRLHRQALVTIPTVEQAVRDELLARVDEVAPQVSQGSFRDLASDLTQALSESSADSDVHSIANLALLASGDNSALSNSVFEVKRSEILRLDREGSYIPVCTRNAFLKYYTESAAQQIHFWGSSDRTAYLAEMVTMVRPYLISEEATS